MRATPPLFAQQAVLAGRRMRALMLARQRMVMGGLVFAFIWLVVGVRLVDLSVLAPLRSDKGSHSFVARGPLRADIVARDGEVLARSVMSWTFGVNPHKISGNKALLSRQIAAILPGINPDWVLTQLTTDQRFRFIQRRISQKQYDALYALGDEGFSFNQEPDRVYPNGPLAAHVLGYVNIDGAGRFGLERTYNGVLSGAARAPERLVTTLDRRVQHALEDELAAAMALRQAKAAMGVVMDANTGEILAMASLPAFDPNAPSGNPDAWFNRPVQGIYELGSIFKAFNTAMALEEGVVRATTVFDVAKPLKVGRFRIGDSHKMAPRQSVEEILINSSNIGTAQIADLVGAETQRRYFDQLGLLTPAPIELSERGQPQSPNPWGRVATMTSAYGHGVSVTLVQAASAFAAVVNGGVWRPATLIRTRAGDQALGHRVFSEMTSAHVRRMLRRVVTEGTARQAEAPGYDVGGKTGTAEKADGGRYNRSALISSFMGAFPMKEPRYVIAVTLDEPKGSRETAGFATAGWVAAPIMRPLVERVAPLLDVAPDFSQTTGDVAALSGIAPAAGPLDQDTVTPPLVVTRDSSDVRNMGDAE